MNTLPMETQWRDLCARIAPRRPPAPRPTLFADPDIGPQPLPAAKRPALTPMLFLLLDLGWMALLFIAAGLLIHAGYLQAASAVSIFGVATASIFWIVFCTRRYPHV